MKLMPPTEETIKAPVPFYVCTILRTDFIRLDRYHLPIGGFAFLGMGFFPPECAGFNTESGKKKNTAVLWRIRIRPNGNSRVLVL